jgi:hypothetical protein
MNTPFRLHIFNDHGEILHTRTIQPQSEPAYSIFEDMANLHQLGLLSPAVAYMQMYRDDLLVATTEPNYPAVYE